MGGGRWWRWGGIVSYSSSFSDWNHAAITVLKNSSERAPDLHPGAACEDNIVSMISVEGDEWS